ncbi:MAG: tRNA preQ1(34) S-adenosylmethionine ribosyltransferase-isomerase QueA [Burkholderiales bacterium]|nr:tRNA preQ1(34) S-adenosylmethionine ribosyltransferase-isomerase QueA [Burkholderiales bacterium]
MSLRLTDFDYDLPPELIAQVPTATRAASRLLHVDGETLADRRFSDLPGLLAPGDLVVLNDTRVLNARVLARKPSGGRVELLVERIIAEREAWVQLRASHPPREGAPLDLPDGASARVLGRDDRFFHLAFDIAAPLHAWLAQHGELPLPPYVQREANASDDERYQTIYARAPGAVAAPTAGLHFDEATFAALARRDVQHAFLTLHVGAGTFLPVREEEVSRHRMHEERYELPAATVRAIAAAQARGARVIAVGTTTLRALEAAAQGPAGLVSGPGTTSLFITPGFRFRVVDRLLTNFHLPRSTLLMLVSAFAGPARIRAAYAHAVAARYRFFSYGDAMLLDRAPTRDNPGG